LKAEEKIARLQGLLERVRRNASLPRMSAPEPAEAEAAEPYAAGVADLVIDEGEDEEETGVVEVGEPIEAIDAGEIEGEELDLTEDELVDLTEPESLRPPPEPEPAEPASIDWEEVEEPPASSRRPIAAESLDAALASPLVEMDEGREIPLKTPPPESGPQAAPPQIPTAPPLPLDAEPLSEGDIESTGRAPLRAGEPLFDLEVPPAEAIEIAEPERFAPPEPQAPAELAPESGEVAPQVVERPAIQHAAPSAYVAASRGFQPTTFVELLDASLGLGE